ncbi:hypothetical protein [Yersinia phage MHG19]|nr:hypothetical protein [Yersinia phage MHG19]
MYNCDEFVINEGEIVGQGEFNKSKTKIFVKCHKCNETSQYKATVLKAKIKTERWCSVCNLKHSYVTSKLVDEKEAIKRINSVSKLYRFKSWVGEYSTFTKSKANIQCSTCNNTWQTNLNNFTLKSKGCPICCQKGFNSKTPAILYVNKVEYQDGIALKYGITSNHDFRIWQQNTSSNCVSSKLYFKEFTAGKDARQLEMLISKLYASYRHFLTKDIMADGYTETLPYHLKDDLINFIEGWKG